MDIIFDIDGTLADLTHRRHFVRSKPKNWKAFDAGMAEDKPIYPVIAALVSFKRADTNNRIILCSGRSEPNRGVTVDWLKRHNIWQYVDNLYMRAANDYRADDIIKEELLDRILEDGYYPAMVFDDRPRVVRMWRRRGLYVFDCNQTEEDF